MQINDMHQKINREKERGARLKQKVQILGSLNTADQVRAQNGGSQCAPDGGTQTQGNYTSIETLVSLKIRPPLFTGWHVGCFRAEGR